MTSHTLRTAAEDKVNLLEQFAMGNSNEIALTGVNLTSDARRAVQAALVNQESVTDLESKIDSLIPEVTRQSALKSMNVVRDCFARGTCTFRELNDAFYFAEYFREEARKAGIDLTDNSQEWNTLKNQANQKIVIMK